MEQMSMRQQPITTRMKRQSQTQVITQASTMSKTHSAVNGPSNKAFQGDILEYPRVFLLKDTPYNCTGDFTHRVNKTADQDTVKHFYYMDGTRELCEEMCINKTRGNDKCTGFLYTNDTTDCTLIFGRYKEQDNSDNIELYQRSCNFNEIFDVEFYVQPKQTNFVMELGKPVTVACEVYGADNAVISISFKSREVSTEPYYRIPTAGKEDDGEYSCSVKRNSGDPNPIVKKLQLMVRYHPEFINSTGSEAAPNSGETVNLTCNFKGLPMQVKWTKNEQSIPSSTSITRHIVFHADGVVSDTILIMSKQWNIYGQYKCEGSNDYGQAIGTVQLKNNNCLGLQNDNEGTCLYGCIQGKHGLRCDINCTDDCLVCHPISGYCLLNVHNVTDGNFTDSSCSSGKYGYDCNKDCSSNCVHATSYGFKCEKFTGACIEPCADGVYGSYCTLACGPCSSSYGNLTSCNRETGICDSCTAKCVNRNCKADGSCKSGCISGYSGSFCDVTTSHGTKLYMTGTLILIIGSVIFLFI